MAAHNEIGKKGEVLAVTFLEEKGYQIVHRNWRYSYYEIDIIATRSNKLHFIEVKTRNEAAFGHPEDSVTKRKFKYLQKAADEYLFLNPGHQRIQYDILAITFKKNNAPEYFLLEDVFL